MKQDSGRVTGPVYTREKTRVGRVPRSVKIAHGLGALAGVFKGFAFATFLLFFYNQVLGLPVVLASAAIGLTTVLDALVDPLIGSFSDTLRTRLGRRHPMMFAAVVPAAAALYLVFSPPPGLSETALFVWLFLTTALANVAMSVFSVPWTALSTELSEDYAERTDIVTWCYVVGWAGGLAFTYVIWSFVFRSSPQFRLGQLDPANYRLFAPVAAVVTGAVMLLSTWLTSGQLPYLAQRRDESQFGLRLLAGQIAATFSNRDFMVLFGGALMSACIGGTAAALGTYLTTYFWGLRPEDLRWFALAVFGAIAAFFAIAPLQRRFDKKTLMIACFALLLLDGVGVVFLRLLDVLPPNGDPRLIGMLIANQVFRTTLETVLQIMFISMLADSLDLQELRSGERQEGMFAAALAFCTKATAGLGAVLGGFLLQGLVHWPSGAAPADIDPAVLRRLGFYGGVLIPFAYIVPLALGLTYRITRAAHADIRLQLDALRADDPVRLGAVS